jgi:superfamily II DNA or RNA helicase
LLLDGIIGPIVYTKTLQELVEEGFLARPVHYAMRLQSHSRFVSDDVLEMTRAHIYESPVLGAWAADLANKFHQHYKHPVLILLDTVSQFKYIYPHLKFQCGFAHGGLTKDNKGEVPEMYHEGDNDKLVEQFNSYKLPILIGTSCIATGTDIQTTRTLINLQAGKSEIKFSQGRGRGTRIVEGKTEFNYIDYDLQIPGVGEYDNPFHRHFLERESYCTSPVKMLR